MGRGQWQLRHSLQLATGVGAGGTPFRCQSRRPHHIACPCCWQRAGASFRLLLLHCCFDIVHVAGSPENAGTMSHFKPPCQSHPLRVISHGPLRVLSGAVPGFFCRGPTARPQPQVLPRHTPAKTNLGTPGSFLLFPRASSKRQWTRHTELLASRSAHIREYAPSNVCA